MKVQKLEKMKLKDEFWSLTSDGMLKNYELGQSIDLTGNVRKVEVVEHLPGSSGESKLTRGAAGAVLGFLVAGPIGTLAGAGLGAGGASEAQGASYRVYLTIANPFHFFNATVNDFELRILQRNLIPEPEPSTVKPAPVPVKPPAAATSETRARPAAASVEKKKPAPAKRARSTAKVAGMPVQSEELKKRLAKLDFLLREQIITTAEWDERSALAKATL